VADAPALRFAEGLGLYDDGVWGATFDGFASLAGGNDGGVTRFGADVFVGFGKRELVFLGQAEFVGLAAGLAMHLHIDRHDFILAGNWGTRSDAK
jgi:hypothetical protein